MRLPRFPGIHRPVVMVTAFHAVTITITITTGKSGYRGYQGIPEAFSWEGYMSDSGPGLSVICYSGSVPHFLFLPREGPGVVTYTHRGGRSAAGKCSPVAAQGARRWRRRRAPRRGIPRREAAGTGGGGEGAGAGAGGGGSARGCACVHGRGPGSAGRSSCTPHGRQRPRLSGHGAHTAPPSCDE